MVTKVLKIEIKRPLNTDKNTFYQAMRDMQYQCWKFANKAITMLWDYQQFDFAYKERFGKYFLKEQGALPNGYRKIGSDILNVLKDEIPTLHSNCKDAMIRMVEKKWKNDLKDVLSGNKSIATFKRSLPIELHNKQFMDSKKNVRIFNENGVYSTIISLLPKPVAQEVGMADGNFHLELIVKDNYQIAIVDRVINGEYKLSMSKMLYDERKKKWFLLLTYLFEAQREQLDENRILGIDLGLKIPAMLAISDNPYFQKAIGNAQEIEMFEKQVVNRKKRLQKSRVWAGEGSIGHGTKKRTQALDKIGEKIANYKKTKNHCWSREIINVALRENCGTIQMEELKGISEEKTFLKRWTYSQLQEMIINKAVEYGIKVVKIEPSYTSQRCHKCGCINSGNRETQEKFKCTTCNYECNADVNAARNIATKDIEEIIKKQLEVNNKQIAFTLEYD